MNQSINSSAAMPISGQPVQPIKAWAILGIVFLVTYAYVLGSWITGPDFKPSPLGSDPIPEGTLFLIRFTEVFCATLSLWFIYYMVLRPWIRDKQLSWDGMLVISLTTMWVLDPICNYFNFSFMYNGYFLNMGSWTMSLPGWQAPRQGNLPEPLLLMSGIYIWWTTINVLAFCYTLKKLKT